MNKLFKLQNFLARQLSGKLNYINNKYWQDKKITGESIFEKIQDFTISVDDFTSLSVDDAKKLGFCLWSEDQPNLYLIPSYLWSFLPKGLKVVSFNNDDVVIEKPEDIDNDERFGCLAYGINIE